jgi:hypothetical protein
VKFAPPKPGRLTLESSVSDFLEHPFTGPILTRAVANAGADEEEGGTTLLDMVSSMPMRRMLRFPGVNADPRQIRRLVAIANNPVVRTVSGWMLRIRGRR